MPTSRPGDADHGPGFVVEPARADDAAEIVALYRAVAAIEGGLARTVAEISPDYVHGFLSRSLATGICLVARATDAHSLLGEIHAYAIGPQVFAHVLGELTIAVNPRWQGRGVGRALFTELLRVVAADWPQILRVELVARESNGRALAFYRDLGFREEGRLEGRVRGVAGGYEADVPMGWRRPG